MNRFIGLLSFLFSSILFGQITAVIESWNTGWVDVNSYSGKTTSNLIVNFIKVQNSQAFNLEHWSVTIRVDGVITNNKTNFPPEKLKFRFNDLNVESSGNGVRPTPSTINVNTGVLSLGIADTYLVQQSPFSLNMVDYMGIKFFYDVIVEPGDYMTPHSSWDNFKVNLIVDFRNKNGNLISSVPVFFMMRIRPTDTAPQIPTYGLQFDANALNVALEFKTASDYANGVTKTQTKAFSTFSNTPYVVRVNTLGTNLVSSTNKTLPVDAVKLTVKENQGGAITGTVNLSGSQQNVISSAAHSSTKYFDAIYSTQAGDTTFLNKSSEQYSGTLVYTMIPQ